MVGFASAFFAGASAGDPKGINAGDTAWVLIASALVMMMTPLVGVLYGGMVTSKNVISMIKQSLLILAVVSIQWVVIGYSLVFGTDLHGIIGGLNFFALQGVGYAPSAYAPTVPQSAFMIFEAMGAVIAPALIIGSTAQRFRFRTLVIFVLLWTTFVYDPIAHWVWGNGGWLHNLGTLDFAGGAVVHTSAGFSGLAAAIVIGKRREFKIGEAITSHNIPVVLLAVALLWFGWLGFNGGSALAADAHAVNAFVTTNTSGAAGALVWMILSWAENKKPSAMATAIGGVCGLIAVTPASGFVGPVASIAIGIIAGVVTYLAFHLRNKYLPVDDTLDVWAAHGVGGATGIILTGVFAEKAVNSAGNDGLLFGNPSQLAIQILAASITLIFAFVATVFLLKLLAPLGLRVSDQEEEEGLDLAVHGEEGYQLAIAPAEANNHVAQPTASTGNLHPQVELPNSAFSYQFQSETGGLQKIGTAPLRSQMGTQNNGSRYGVQTEFPDLQQHLQEERLAQLEMGTAELRLRLESENAELRLRLQEERISHLEATNEVLRQRLGNTTSTNLRAYKQFVVPASASSTKNLV